MVDISYKKETYLRSALFLLTFFVVLFSDGFFKRNDITFAQVLEAESTSIHYLFIFVIAAFIFAIIWKRERIRCVALFRKATGSQ